MRSRYTWVPTEECVGVLLLWISCAGVRVTPRGCGGADRSMNDGRLDGRRTDGGWERGGYRHS
jgi:hypothetical protein